MRQRLHNSESHPVKPWTRASKMYTVINILLLRLQPVEAVDWNNSEEADQRDDRQNCRRI